MVLPIWITRLTEFPTLPGAWWRFQRSRSLTKGSLAWEWRAQTKGGPVKAKRSPRSATSTKPTLDRSRREPCSAPRIPSPPMPRRPMVVAGPPWTPRRARVTPSPKHRRGPTGGPNAPSWLHPLGLLSAPQRSQAPLRFAPSSRGALSISACSRPRLASARTGSEPSRPASRSSAIPRAKTSSSRCGTAKDVMTGCPLSLRISSSAASTLSCPWALTRSRRPGCHHDHPNRLHRHRHQLPARTQRRKHDGCRRGTHRIDHRAVGLAEGSYPEPCPGRRHRQLRQLRDPGLSGEMPRLGADGRRHAPDLRPARS